MKLSAMVAVSSFALSQVAAGQAVQWKVSEGGNGHWYEYRSPIAERDFVVWAQYAVDHGGNLASLQSDAERLFIANSLSYGVEQCVGGHAFLGGFQPSDAQEPASGWQWTSGEPFEVPRSWWFSLEDCCDGFYCDGRGEDAMVIIGAPGDCTTGTTHVGQLNDFGACRDEVGAVIEWSADCNNDGIVDYGQCREGSLPDYNVNNIPDCCEQGTECAVGSYPIVWRIEDGGNGHLYQLKVSAEPLCWPVIAGEARALGGYLATETSSQEHDFIADAIVGRDLAWTGRYGPFVGAELISGSWTWMTGEPWSFTSWYPGEPNGGENRICYIAIGEGGGCGKTTNWNDEDDCASMVSTPCDQGVRTYILEWSADCNNDGLVDYGQILTGQLADANANGVPDICEAYEVPAEFSTIQAAIDAVPAGQYGLVLVAAGTRNESFSLNGKNIRVQGAPNNATILDGTGLTTSSARFTGGEPATAGLANLVFRNGTAGSRIYPKATFTVGGAVYGINSAATITNCRFEQNEADFGGAVYLLRCDSAVEACIFAGNEALTDGGAFFAYECAGSVRGSDFTANSCGASGSGNGGAFKTVGAKTAGGTFLLQDCTITGTISGVDGAAVQHFENEALGVRGVLRIVSTEITGNSAAVGASGVRIDGRQSSCVLSGGTTICANTPRNISGPFLIEGTATVCGCLADVTGDGVVNGGDLGVVLSSWGGADAIGTGDANHDGVVNGSDLGIVLSGWGACGG